MLACINKVCHDTTFGLDATVEISSKTLKKMAFKLANLI